MFIVHPKYSVTGIYFFWNIFFNFLRIGYQVLGQFLHLKARGAFGYIIRVTLFFDAEWITIEPNKEKRYKKRKKGKNKKQKKIKKKSSLTRIRTLNLQIVNPVLYQLSYLTKHNKTCKKQIYYLIRPQKSGLSSL